MDAVRYFAYGSNMLREWLQARCQQAKIVGLVCLPAHRLAFDKLSKDGSGKCGYMSDSGSSVWGVLWELPEASLSQLDRIEGVGNGYERAMIQVEATQQTLLDVITYRPTRTHPDVLPYDWYWALVMAGARQNNLPAEYVATLARVKRVADADMTRTVRLTALAALGASGYGEILEP